MSFFFFFSIGSLVFVGEGEGFGNFWGQASYDQLRGGGTLTGACGGLEVLEGWGPLEVQRQVGLEGNDGD